MAHTSSHNTSNNSSRKKKHQMTATNQQQQQQQQQQCTAALAGKLHAPPPTIAASLTLPCTVDTPPPSRRSTCMCRQGSGPTRGSGPRRAGTTADDGHTVSPNSKRSFHTTLTPLFHACRCAAVGGTFDDGTRGRDTCFAASPPLPRAARALSTNRTRRMPRCASPGLDAVRSDSDAALLHLRTSAAKRDSACAPERPCSGLPLTSTASSPGCSQDARATWSASTDALTTSACTVESTSPAQGASAPPPSSLGFENEIPSGTRWNATTKPALDTDERRMVPPTRRVVYKR